MNQTSSHFSSSPSLQISPMSVASIPSFDKSGLDPAQVSLSRLQQIIGLLDSSLRLPNTPRAFMVYLFGLTIVFAGAFMHVMVAAQIMQAEWKLAQLQEQYRALEQQNGDIIFQIARDTSMARLYERVLADGYVTADKREYVFPEQEPVFAAAPATESSAQAVAPTANTVAETAPAQATTTSATLAAPTTSWGDSQLARWETFWNNTLFPATGATMSNVQSGAAPATSAKSAPDFWSVWWKQANEQGTKLMEQFRSQ